MCDRDQPCRPRQRWADRVVVAHLEITEVDRDARPIADDLPGSLHSLLRFAEERVSGGPPRCDLDTVRLPCGGCERRLALDEGDLALDRIPPAGVVDLGD